MSKPTRKRSKLIRFLTSSKHTHFKTRSERREIIGLMFKVAFLEAMALSLILPTVTSTGEITTICSKSINPCPIFFDNIQTSGNAGTGLFAPTINLQINITATNEIMIVSAGGNGNVNAVSATDTQGNNFLHPLTAVNSNIGATLDVFTTFPLTTGLETLTVTFAGGVPDVVINIGFYKNVESTGRVSTLASAVSVTNLWTQFNTTRSGSLVLGFTELNPGTNPGIVASPGFIQRTDQPTITGSQQELDFEEANRTYTSNTVFPFNPSWPTLGANQALIGELELLPNLHQGFDYPECAPTNDTCHVNIATKATGITNANQLLHAGTTYCTGVTTFKLVTSTTSVIEVAGQYSLESRNVTGQIFTVFIGLSNTAPSTVFGTGVCGSGGGSSSINLVAQTTSTTGTGYTATFDFAIANEVANSYWGSISITPKTTNVAIDNLGTNGQVATPGSTILIKQLK